VREIGLITSPARPKLEEYVENDAAPGLLELENPAAPDSLRGAFPDGEMALSILIDTRGRVVLHELPWYEPSRYPAPMVARLTAGMPRWRFTPAMKHGAPLMVWAVVPVSIRS
jgi:hypothetical protein